MGMQINTNLAALTAHRNLSNTQNDLSKSLEKLSSGLRINRAADDAAGLAISEGLRSQVNGMSVAARNAQDGISVIQTAEGALTETHSILQRMRDLAVQAGNDSNNGEARDAIAKEASALTSELQRISSSTNFGGINLLDGSAGTLQFQVGAEGGASSQIALDLSGSNVGTVANALNGLGEDGTTALAYHKNTIAVDTTAADVDIEISQGSGTDISLTIAQNSTDDEIVATLQAKLGEAFTVSQATDADGLAIAGSFEITSNDLSNDNVIDISFDAGVTPAGVQATETANVLDFSSAAGAQKAIERLDTQISSVSAARADLGAVQNRFESTINSLNVSRENLQAAESRIRDVDMAAEMVNFTRSNILSQAGTAMLAQANQSNQGVLQLLG